MYSIAELRAPINKVFLSETAPPIAYTRCLTTWCMHCTILPMLQCGWWTARVRVSPEKVHRNQVSLHRRMVYPAIKPRATSWLAAAASCSLHRPVHSSWAGGGSACFAQSNTQFCACPGLAITGTSQKRNEKLTPGRLRLMWR